MDRNTMYASIREICKFYKEKYKPDAMKLVEPAILAESVFVLEPAIERIKTEFNRLPPLAKVRDIIQQEGRKVREEETQERERQAEREKRESIKKLPEGHTEYSRACCAFLKSVFSGHYDRSELQAMAEQGDKQFPGRGFDQWARGLSAGRIIPDRKTMAGGG